MLELWETTRLMENNILMWLDATFSETEKKQQILSTDIHGSWIMSKT